MRRKIASLLFYLLFAIFVYYYIRRLDFGRLAGVGFDPWMLGAATGLAMVYRYWGVLIWFQILKGLGAGPIHNKITLAFVYAKSWLGRYLPGKVTWILGKIYFASQHGVPKSKLAVSSMLEGALQVSVTLFLSVALLGFDKRLGVFGGHERTLVLVVGVAVGLGVLMLPPVFNGLLRFSYARLKKKRLHIEDRVDGRTLVRGVLLYTAGFFATGLSYFFFTKSMYPALGYEHIVFIVAVFNLAGAIGIISLFAPSGLGVREGVQLIFLPVVMSAELALVVTVAARLWSLLVDGMFFATAWLHRQAYNQSGYSMAGDRTR